MEESLHPQAINSTEEKKILKEFPKETKKPSAINIKIVLSAFLVVVLGVATGWFMSGNKSQSSGNGTTLNVAQNENGEIEEAGVKDESAYPDKAEGVLEKGGIEGEGTHHLVRDGGPSQTVYLISTVADLDLFVGKKVEIWGQTMAAGKKAGWFMDVGKIKVIK